MEGFITQASNFVWSPALVALCLLGGLWFSVRGRFLQLRLIGEMIRLLFQKKVGEVGISSFQALTMTLAGRVGTGNIAGVATAICFGGPGALFWMWVVAFLGASSAFVESTLGQVFKVNIDGEYRGGPAYYPKSSAIEPRKPSWLWLIKCRAASGTVGRASRTRCSSASFPAASSRRSSSRSQTTRGLESGTWPQAIS